MDSLCGRLAPRVLFSQRPRLHFCPPAGVCECGGATRVSKTRTKSVATLVIGQFEAIETQRHCPCCGAHDRCDELRSLTPHRGRFGFDVIEWVGRALFVEGRNERAVQAELAARNIPISTSEVGFLGKRFIVYLALAHRACQDALREHLCAKGGYILHLDATCEGDSPQLFSAMDELSRMVLGNRKMPSEDSRHMIPLLEELKAAYGVPLALVHDMGSAILKAAATVFPTVPSFVCHFHFLRDLGKDLFGFEYRTIYRYTRAFKTKATLRRAAKSLRAVVDHEAHLRDQMHTYLRDKQALHERAELNPWLTAYLLVVWVLEAGSACEGFGFPFDRAHLLFYQRLREAYPALKQLQAEGVTGLPVATLQRVVRDAALSRLVTRIEQKITHFDQLRNVMRIARPDSGQGLNDEGDGEVRTVAKGVQVFRESQTITALSESDLSYRKMVKQIDKYWEKLFADPIAVDTPAGRVLIQPQRTNNLMEQSFRFLKRDGRKKTGHKVLSKTLVAMLADTPLVRNLDNPDYLRILLQGKLTLAERFADIDIQQVRQHEHESSRQFRKYPKHMRRLLRVPHLPRKLVKTAAA